MKINLKIKEVVVQACLIKQYRKKSYQIVFFQSLVSSLLASVFFILFGMPSLVSLFLGGAIVIVSNFIFATFAFSFVGGSDPDKVLKGFYRGEVLKLLFTMSLLAVVFSTLKIDFYSFFVGYSCSLASSWTTLLLFKQR